MQNRAFNLRWTPAALAIAATVGLSVSVPANAASTMSDPIAAAIASAGGGPATSKSGAGSSVPSAAAQAAGNGTSTTASTPATETAQASRPTEASELAGLQSQLALWKAKAEIAKYRAEVKRAEDSLTAAPAGAAPGAGVPSVSLGGPMPTGGVAERAPRLAPEAPRLLSLRAFDGHYNAVVDVSGRTVPVQAGDTLEGGWRVVSINDDGVKLANGKRVRTLRP